MEELKNLYEEMHESLAGCHAALIILQTNELNNAKKEEMKYNFWVSSTFLIDELKDTLKMFNKKYDITTAKIKEYKIMAKAEADAVDAAEEKHN